MVKQAISILLILILLTSCDNSFPAGFWTTFHRELIIDQNSDQGPRGDHREIHWKTLTSKPFNEKQLLDFASKNDWKLVDSFSLNTNTTSDSAFIQLINNEYSLYLLESKILAKEKLQGWKLYMFKTPWMLVDLRDSGETFENGFALLNSNKTELKIIHFWGE